MNAPATTADARNRTFTAFELALIAISIVVGVWLATSVGDLVTALWMVLFVAVGVVFVSLGRHPSAER
ncbi:MAG: hypothetical protein ABEJ44_07765 [Halanaeroarchaeum sp.]